MRTFTLHLQSAARCERIPGVESFVGEDASGSFGVLGGRARLVSVLRYGLAQFRPQGSAWRYVACPGGVLEFAGDDLHLSTRRFVVDDDYGRMRALIDGQLEQEEAALATLKQNLGVLEQELVRRLRRLGRGEP